MLDQFHQIHKSPPSSLVAEIRLSPTQWRIVLIALQIFIADIEDSIAELDESDAEISIPTLATAMTAFKIAVRTCRSLRNAVETALSKRTYHPPPSHGATQGEKRVAVRHAALPIVPSIIEDAARRLNDHGRIEEARALSAILPQITKVLAVGSSS